MLKRISKALLGIMLCCAAANVSAGPRAVFMGDSIFKGWSDQVSLFFSENNFLNKGISGHTTADMLLRYKSDVVNSGASAVVIMAGINEAIRKVEETTAAEMEKITGQMGIPGMPGGLPGFPGF